MKNLAALFRLQNEQETILFRSYWVHPIVQLVLLTFYWLKDSLTMRLYLLIFLDSTLMVIAYVSFIFPITGYLLVWAYRIALYFAPDKKTSFFIICSMGFYLLFASSLFFLFMMLIGFYYGYPFYWIDIWQMLATYVIPILFVGELFRQRMVMAKVYLNL
ncbi:MAG: hypothetical protein HC913_15580 [Microscillaceae bacterium]|nr:hypothetical protein [Microscillaceae bacterium]